MSQIKVSLRDKSTSACPNFSSNSAWYLRSLHWSDNCWAKKSSFASEKDFSARAKNSCFSLTSNICNNIQENYRGDDFLSSQYQTSAWGGGWQPPKPVTTPHPIPTTRFFKIHLPRCRFFKYFSLFLKKFRLRRIKCINTFKNSINLCKVAFFADVKQKKFYPPPPKFCLLNIRKHANLQKFMHCFWTKFMPQAKFF